MIRNYLLVALRNLGRQFSYSLINVSGLAIGIACSLVMFLFVYNEWSYDRHFENGDRIYKIGISFYNMGEFAVGPEVMGDVLPKEFEGVEAFTRIKQQMELPIQSGETTFNERVFYTDSSFFKVFSYKFVEGDARTALSAPASIVMTESAARKYFNGADPMGKTVLTGKDKVPFTVTGVVKDDPRSSQMKVSVWLSIETQRKFDKTWTSAGFYCYALLKEKNTQQDLDNALDRILEKEIFPASGPMSTGTFDEYKNNPLSVKFHVIPFLDVHLKSTAMFEISPIGNESNMYAFAGLSIFIVALASVNFINLTTARASRRAKEVGIRKAVGSSRSKLIGQFTLESVMISMAALLLALGLAEAFVRLFELITGDQLINTIWTSIPGIVGIVLFALVVGLVSGIYPAFYLTSFQPVKVLKGNVSTGRSGSFRNVLVVFQFAISVCLMICSAIIFRQMNFMQTKDLGFDQQNVVTIDRMSVLKEKSETYRNAVAQFAGVQKTSFHAGEPGSKMIVSVNVFETEEMPQGLSLSTYNGDAEYIDFMGFHVVKGRSFIKDLASDSSSVVLNEAAVKALNLTDPIGKKLGKENPQYVIGVVRDFNWESLRNEIAPMAIALGKPYQLGVKIERSRVSEFLKMAEAEWKKLAPDEPFKYHFLDDNFGEMLKQERIFSNAIGFFTVLAIFISCLGLYGLSAFTAEQRTKEIGIRKVLGARVSDIVNMLNWKFASLVIVAVVIAVPVSYYLMNSWMENFAFRAEMRWWLYAFSIVAAMAVALLTVSFHSFRAATINPAQTLKYE